VGNTFNDSVQAEAAKVVGHPSDWIVAWIEAQQLRQQRAHLPVVEPTQLETENDQNRE
jgi:hypothetical protein